MKIIHTADLHLDSAIEGFPRDVSAVRRKELARVFERICEYADENGVSAVILAGDVFDGNRVSEKTLSRFRSAIAERPQITFFCVAGNHDGGRAELFDGMPENLKVFGARPQSYAFGDVVITGASADGRYSPLFYELIRLDADKINILCLHGQTVQYRPAGESDCISLPCLKGKNIDYLALGHIHSYSRGNIDERGVYAYCGCPDGRGFDETGKKGFLLLETDNGRITEKFIPFSTREVTEVIFTVAEDENFYALKNRVISELKATVPKTAILKAVLIGEVSPDFQADAESLDVALNEHFFYAKVNDKTTIKLRAEDYFSDKSFKGEFVRSILSSDLSEEDKKEAISLGLLAIRGELR